MSLASYALTDIQSVEDALGASPSPQPQRLEEMINAASWMIIHRADQEFKPLDSSTIRVFPVTGDGYVGFGVGAAQSVSVVRANVETTSPTTLAATDYQTRVSQNGTIRSLQLVTNWSVATRPTTGMVEVTGVWGWAFVPPDVKDLCEFQVVQWVRRNSQVRSNVGSVDSGEQSVPAYAGLASSVKRALDAAYRTVVVA
jgi:hypothetical protein